MVRLRKIPQQDRMHTHLSPHLLPFLFLSLPHPIPNFSPTEIQELKLDRPFTRGIIIPLHYTQIFFLLFSSFRTCHSE